VEGGWVVSHIENNIDSPICSPFQLPKSMVSGRRVSASRMAFSSSRCMAAYLRRTTDRGFMRVREDTCHSAHGREKANKMAYPCWEVREGRQEVGGRAIARVRACGESVPAPLTSSLQSQLLPP
jgi:hypothetical protein